MAFWDDSIVEALKAQADISAIIGQFVPLKPNGQNRWIGVCPFHEDHKPSMHVTPELGIYKCFACGAGGDVFRFLMEHEKMDFPMAIRYVAEAIGFSLPDTSEESQEQNLAQNNERSEIAEANQIACSYFESSLRTSESTLHYLKSRGFNEKTIEQFHLGWAPESWDGLIRYAGKNGISKSRLLKAGLLVEKDTGRAYDKFRARLIFPIYSHAGKIVAFGGRVLQNDQKPKYLNSPETPLYHKSDILYGFYHAKNEIAKKSEVIFVEGYMDFLQLFQGGIHNVAAVSGTALTDAHAKIIARYAQKVTLVFDGDAAGKKAANRSLQILLKHGLEIRILLLPPGEDPDSLVKQKGPEFFLNKLKTECLDLLHFQLQPILSKQEHSPEEKTRAVHSLRELLAVIPDSLLREEYAQKGATLLGISPRHLFANQSYQNNYNTPVSTSSQAPLSKQELREANLVSLLLNHPELHPWCENTFNLDLLEDDDYAEIIDTTLQLSANHEDLVSLYNRLPSIQQKKLEALPAIPPMKTDEALNYFTQSVIDFKYRHLEIKRRNSRDKNWKELTEEMKTLQKFRREIGAALSPSADILMKLGNMYS